MVIYKECDLSEIDSINVSLAVGVNNGNDKVYLKVYSYDMVHLLTYEMTERDDHEYSVDIPLADLPDKHLVAVYLWNVENDKEEELEILQPLIIRR